jgi:hypothetical protein
MKKVILITLCLCILIIGGFIMRGTLGTNEGRGLTPLPEELPPLATTTVETKKVIENKPMATPTPPVASSTKKVENTPPVNRDTSLYLSSRNNAPDSDDLREYQHGLSIVPLGDGTYRMVWSSSSNPPQGSDRSGNWTHDIYTSLINPKNLVITPKLLISIPEAQEPASAAISSNGRILITTEDGNDTDYEVSQRFALFDKNLNAIKSYPQTVMEGGHSGHVAAVGNNFVIFFSEGWVDGGGVDNLGTGDDVYAAIVDSEGVLGKTVNISVGNQNRDWWPVVAGSPTVAALLWQRYVPSSLSADLYLSLLNPTSGSIIKSAVKITSSVEYYTYNVSYIPSINRFLILGSYASGGGFGYLIDMEGNITGSTTSLPTFVRESEPAIRGTMAAQAITPGGIALLKLSANSITLHKKITDAYTWQYMGTSGIFLSDTSLYMISLSHRGLIEKFFSF